MSDSSPSPLDVPGWLPERRESVRRVEDRTFVEKCRALLTDLGKLILIASFFGGSVAAIGALLGVHLSGPVQQIASVAARTDSLDARVGRLEQGAAQTHEQLRDITGDVRFLSYQLCITTRSHDAVAQDRCQAIQQSFRAAP